VRLRSYLLLLTLATLLPVALFGMGLAAMLVERDRATFRRGSEARALAIITAVDAAMRGSIATMQALAISPSLDRGEMSDFHDTAGRMLELQPDWANIHLALPSGRQLVNIRQASGDAPRATDSADASFARVLRTGQAAIGNAAYGAVTGTWDIPVRVPVMRNGALKYVLTAIVRPESIGELLTAQHLPVDWTAVVLDENRNIVASNLRTVESLGRPASSVLLGALGDAPSGWIRGRVIDDADLYASYRRSELTGWAAALGIPVPLVDVGEKRAAWVLAIGVLGAIGLGLTFASMIGRRISGPIVTLAAATEAVGRGAHLEIPQHHAVREIRLLALALRSAAHAMRERQQLIEREKEALMAADRAKDEFLATLSHELRNPLVALTTAAYVLRVADPGDKAMANARSVIQRQVGNMTRLIEDLLDISRITVGKAPLHREIFDLGDAVSNVIQAWRSGGSIEPGRISVEAYPAWIEADPVRIEQIFSNLLHNALKFTPPGKAIEVSVRQEGGDAVLRVLDEGIGLSQQSLQRIFEPFVQIERDLSRGNGGLGLGLALVKRLTEMHGGSVTVESAGPGRGALFSVRLAAVARPQRKPAEAARPPAGARRVLIVEDNDDARHMLEVALSRRGHAVIAVRDAAEGLAIAAEAHPEVALIDIGLRGMDGYELARRLRASGNGRGMTLIALSGYGRDEDQRKALRAGFDLYLVKPVTPERLNQTITGAL
jgi:signal transduction histidine kinase